MAPVSRRAAFTRLDVYLEGYLFLNVMLLGIRGHAHVPAWNLSCQPVLASASLTNSVNRRSSSRTHPASRGTFVAAFVLGA